VGPVGKKNGSLQATINVTPLVDVVLVLLIIFMVVTPMLSQGNELVLPKAVLAEATPSAAGSIVLRVDSRHQLQVAGVRIHEDQLLPTLRKAARDQTPRILLEADANVPATYVRKLLKTMKASGFSHVAFAVMEKRGSP
jgi:biopolymer transport protein TolR